MVSANLREVCTSKIFICLKQINRLEDFWLLVPSSLKKWKNLLLLHTFKFLMAFCHTSFDKSIIKLLTVSISFGWSSISLYVVIKIRLWWFWLIRGLKLQDIHSHWYVNQMYQGYSSTVLKKQSRHFKLNQWATGCYDF